MIINVCRVLETKKSPAAPANFTRNHISLVNQCSNGVRFSKFRLRRYRGWLVYITIDIFVYDSIPTCLVCCPPRKSSRVQIFCFSSFSLSPLRPRKNQIILCSPKNIYDLPLRCQNPSTCLQDSPRCTISLSPRKIQVLHLGEEGLYIWYQLYAVFSAIKAYRINSLNLHVRNFVS